MVKKLDLRSDTASLPTEKMKKAMFNATLGDDILKEDPSVNELEELAASMLGMEAALFVISGTMANQIAVMTLTERGQEVILGPESHLYNLEVAGLAALSQVQVRPVKVENGCYDIDHVKEAIQEKGIQSATTGLICLENTYNLNEGSVVPLKNMAEIKEIADKHNIPVYLDGARLFNAAAYLGVKPSEVCQHVDAVQFCLTKGLGCPLGSILAGPKTFIEEAKRIRQRLGGGMRQAGVIAAPGIVGLTEMVDRIGEDHVTAAKLFNGLRTIPGIKPTANHFHTNIVSVEIDKDSWNADRFIEALKKYNILVKKVGSHRVRMVTHYHIRDEDINHVVQCIQTVME
ncbi:threonine aldolase family protein [Siminovitchia sediminis]|uniref:Threonine aldolase family protein n=1 Tax=Siminovitchia sediminis TaxID=1274353 RepID=A0ABW4KQ14_9BACI